MIPNHEKKIRNFIDNRFPLLGYKFHLLRDYIFRNGKIKTEFNFLMIGSSTYKKYETNEANLFLRLLENSEIVIDIGANFGFYTLLAATRGKTVCSIEPSPRSLKILKKPFSK